MKYSSKRTFKDDWLAQALIYYQIIDKGLYEELAERFSDRPYLFDVMVENNYLTPDDIAEFVESALKIRRIDLDKTKINTALLKQIPEELCRKYLFIPFRVQDKEIHIASFNPSNLTAEQEIENITGKYIKTFFAFKDQIEEKIGAHYSPDKLIDSLVGKHEQRSKVRITGDESDRNPAPVVKLVNQIFADAVDDHASDIHIEPEENIAHVRIRIDGVLRNLIQVPKTIFPSLVSRIKIISDLNIAESRKPQDGKAKIFVNDAEVDLRVSVLPTSYGEKIVIRILDKRNAAASFDQMGVRGKNRELLEKCFEFKSGMVLVTGPTGSGKSTTLYAAINRIKSTANNILTIEDPIEYNMDGINQVQVNKKAGVTFASALRSFLRQDPDVILVGEIRDGETAEIAIQAAQTGHLVLSTLHTNDTFATITRLRDMGVDKFNITESVQAVVAQRLVRRLCPHCKTEVPEEKIDPKLIYLMNQTASNGTIYEAKGCQRCGFSGYQGRVGIYEVLILDIELRKKINSGAPLQELRSHAKNNGFQNLFEDAIGLLAEGTTDYKEVLRTINPDSNKNLENRINFEGIKAEQVKQSQPEVAKAKQPSKPEQPFMPKPSSKQERSSLPKPPSKPEAPKSKFKKEELRRPLKTNEKQKTAEPVHVSKPIEQASLQNTEKKIQVLIVEDYVVSRKMLRIMIEKFTPWQVEEAEDGIDALVKITARIPDVILLDIMMPRMDGYEVLQHIRAVPETADIPVIILTGMKSPGSEVKSLELGGDDYLTKPIKREILIARIKKILSRKKSSSAGKPVASVRNEKTATKSNDKIDASEFKLI